MKRLIAIALLVSACMVSTAPGPQGPGPRRPPPNEPPPRNEPPPNDPPPRQDPPPRPSRPWDSTGWKLLGEKVVEGKSDSDQVDFSQKMGAIPTKLTIVVVDSDLEMHDVKVVYTSGNSFTPTFRHYFREDSRSRVIELSKAEILRAVQFKYSNLPGGGRAKVQVWMQ